MGKNTCSLERITAAHFHQPSIFEMICALLVFYTGKALDMKGLLSPVTKS